MRTNYDEISYIRQYEYDPYDKLKEVYVDLYLSWWCDRTRKTDPSLYNERRIRKRLDTEDLMDDFKQLDPNKMKYNLLKERAKHFKEEMEKQIEQW